MELTPIISRELILCISSQLLIQGLEVDHDGSTYTIEISKWCWSGLSFSLPPSLSPSFFPLPFFLPLFFLFLEIQFTIAYIWRNVALWESKSKYLVNTEWFE